MANETHDAGPITLINVFEIRHDDVELFVQEWQERQITNHDQHTLLPLLTSERIRRAAQLGNAIVSDLTSREVTRETPGVDKLFAAVQRMHQLLADLLKDN